MQSALAAGELRASKQAAPRHSSNPSLQSSQLVPMRSKQGPLPPLNPLAIQPGACPPLAVPHTRARRLATTGLTLQQNLTRILSQLRDLNQSGNDRALQKCLRPASLLGFKVVLARHLRRVHS